MNIVFALLYYRAVAIQMMFATTFKKELTTWLNDKLLKMHVTVTIPGNVQHIKPGPEVIAQLNCA